MSSAERELLESPAHPVQGEEVGGFLPLLAEKGSYTSLSGLTFPPAQQRATSALTGKAQLPNRLSDPASPWLRFIFIDFC